MEITIRGESGFSSPAFYQLADDFNLNLPLVFPLMKDPILVFNITNLVLSITGLCYRGNNKEKQT
jgi:hypothetical protein